MGQIQYSEACGFRGLAVKASLALTLASWLTPSLESQRPLGEDPEQFSGEVGGIEGWRPLPTAAASEPGLGGGHQGHRPSSRRHAQLTCE